jgi:hypothetical protein
VNGDWTGRRTAPRVASAGEALVDLIPEMDGDQIVLRVSAGGSPFNVAIGLARLGLAHRTQAACPPMSSAGCWSGG